jgi:hypothetical protein
MRTGSWFLDGRPVRMIPDGDYDRVYDRETGQYLGMTKFDGMYRFRKLRGVTNPLRYRVAWPAQQWQAV